MIVSQFKTSWWTGAKEKEVELSRGEAQMSVGFEGNSIVLHHGRDRVCVDLSFDEVLHAFETMANFREANLDCTTLGECALDGCDGTVIMTPHGTFCAKCAADYGDRRDGDEEEPPS